MYHRFLIYSSADGHIGCFCALAIINSAAMNIGVYVSLSILLYLMCVSAERQILMYVPEGSTDLGVPSQKDLLGSSELKKADPWPLP